MYAIDVKFGRGLKKRLVLGIYRDKARAEKRAPKVINKLLILDHDSEEGDTVEKQADGSYKVLVWAGTMEYKVSVKPYKGKKGEMELDREAVAKII